MHAFHVDARGLRIRQALVALGEAVAAFTRFEFDEGAGAPEGTAQRLTAGRNPYLDWLTRPGRWTLRSERRAAA